MSWISRNAEPDENDRELLRFSEVENEAFRICKHEERCDDNLRIAEGNYILKDEEQWKKWLQEFEDLSATSLCQGDEDNSSAGQRTEVLSSINLIMGGRTSSLSKMPFLEKVFIKLMSRLKIHRSIIRAINRNTSCTFSRMTCAWGGKKSNPRSIGTLL